MPLIEIDPTSELPEDRTEADAAYRASLDSRMVEDWEHYAGDSLESAGIVDEFIQGWQAAEARFKTPKEL